MYFRIYINSHAKKQNIWIFIFFILCFIPSVVAFEARSLLQITIICKFRKFYNYEIYLVSNIKITNKL